MGESAAGSTGLREAALGRIATQAAGEGLMRLGVARLDHRGFEPARVAFDRFLANGFEGEMQFMRRTHEVRKDPAQMLPGARSVLVAAVPYRGGAGSVARYARGVDYHTEIYRRLERVQSALATEAPDSESLICIDTKPLLERAAAALAGLGFIGKHGCLIVPGLGSYVLLGALLTTAEWTGPDAVQSLKKTTWDACGSCRKCLDACPTDAFVAPGELDARKCISYLSIEHRGPIDPALADRFGGWVAGCDVCQEVCPYNASESRERRVPDATWLPERAVESSSPATVAMLTSGRYRAFVRGSALRRIPRRALRRNALIALGNATGPMRADERAAIERGLSDDDPQVRWAAERAQARRSAGDT